MRRTLPAGLLVVLLVAVAAGPAAATSAADPQTSAADPQTSRLSVASDGAQADGQSGHVALSGDGRLAAFVSWATNLVPGDTNGVEDIFVRDEGAGTTTRVSVATDGSEADGASFVPIVSGDGRYVSWASYATNLVPGDTNNAVDVFERDLLTGITTRVSVATDGSQANGASMNPSFSADGRYLAFDSDASNLVAGAAYSHIYLRDRVAGTTTLVSAAADGNQSRFASSQLPRISPDGRYVAFQSDSPALVEGDVNGVIDVFRKDLNTGVTTIASVPNDPADSDGHSYHSALSAEGRYVAFQSSATNTVADDTNSTEDVFVRDLELGITHRVSIAGDGTTSSARSTEPAISSDGHRIAFTSGGDFGLPNTELFGRPSVLVKDLSTGDLSVASVGAGGARPNSQSSGPAFSTDGTALAFYSYASNLVADDTNALADVFVRR